MTADGEAPAPPGERPGEPATGWIDSHCHLQDRYRPEGAGSLDALAEAAAAGVAGVVCVGTDADTSRQAVALVQEVRGATTGAGPGAPSSLPAGFGMWATMGLHPHEASHGLDDLEASLAATVADVPGVVVAVGECGLDYHYEHSPRQVQRRVFAEQVALARRHDLTLVVHSREAWDDTLDVLRSEGIPERTVMHCFTGGPEEATRCLDVGAYLSFSGIVTFKGAQDVRAAAALCPLDHLLIETDAPFLAPVPHRGKENRPAWVVEVGATVAAVKAMAPSDVARSTTEATRRAFALR